MSGLGKGVTFPIAEMMGLGTRLLVPLAELMLLARAALRLGVLEMGRRLLAEALWFRESDPREEERLPVLLPLKDSRRVGVVGKPNSVEMRRDPMGLCERLSIGEMVSAERVACWVGGSSPC